MTGFETVAVEGLARLRQPFPPELVGLLPKVTCRDCTDKRTQCQKHTRQKCQVCDAFVSPAHIHLDFVGHGATTDRLLEVDPEWNWEPVAWDESGLPLFVYNRALEPIRLWIRLTVLDVTRLGVGTCPDGQFDAEKVLIGDALRNAAMRFGVALDLWIKGHAEDDERTTSTSDKTGPARGRDPLADTAPAASKEQRAEVERLRAAIPAGDLWEQVVEWANAQNLPETERLTAVQAQAAIDFMAPIAGEVAAPAEAVEPPPSVRTPTPASDEPSVIAEFEKRAEDIAAKAAKKGGGS